MTATVTYIRDRAFLELVRARQIARDPDAAQGCEIAAAINVLRRSADILDHRAADRLERLAREGGSAANGIRAEIAAAMARTRVRVRQIISDGAA